VKGLYLLLYLVALRTVSLLPKHISHLYNSWSCIRVA